MNALEHYLDLKLAAGRAFFTKDAALPELGLSAKTFLAAAERLAKKGRLAAPRRGFYLILRPEDRAAGAPDPVRWLAPLMAHVGTDYRISLLRAAAYHGSSHQAAMVFQVIVPKQIPKITLGRQNIEFIYQSPSAFAAVNRQEWLDSLKSESGYANVAGIELTLLDCTRYFHKAAGINGAAQIVHDLGGKAQGRVLAAAAPFYENAAVRRLGYLLDHFGHQRAAQALLPFAHKAKSFKPLDPSVREFAALSPVGSERNMVWKLILNERVEIDT